MDEVELWSETESFVKFVALPNTVNAGINNLKSLTPSVCMRRRCHSGLGVRNLEAKLEKKPQADNTSKTDQDVPHNRCASRQAPNQHSWLVAAAMMKTNPFQIQLHPKC